MKKVNLLLAAVVAASVSAPALADYTPNAYFNGYMRAGSGFDKNGNLNGSDDTAHKVGRLGSESKIYGEIGIGADVAKVDDTVWTINSMLAVKSDEATNGAWVDSSSNAHHLVFRQFNAEVKGLFESDKDAKIWVGKKYIQREDIHITDTYYYDISGDGFGIENVTLGQGKWSAAYSKVNNRNHIFDTRYSFPLWDGASFQVGNAFVLDKEQKQATDKDPGDDVTNGNTLTLEFTQGFNGGWNKTVYQWGTGSAVDGIGGNHNAADSVDVTGRSTKGNSHKIYNFGETSLGGDFHLFHQADYSIKNYDNYYTVKEENNVKSLESHKDRKEKEWRVVLRPWYKLTKMTRVYAELGAYGKTVSEKGAQDQNDRLQKVTLAYAITPDAGSFWSRPEIRFFATWMHSTDGDAVFGDGVDTNNKGSTNLCVGAQVEAWW